MAWALLSMTPLKYKIESLGIYSMYEKALFIVKHPTLSSCLEDFIYPITLPFLTACCNIAISMVSFIFLSIRLSFCLLEHSFPGSILKILWAFHWNYKKTPIVFKSKGQGQKIYFLKRWISAADTCNIISLRKKVISWLCVLNVFRCQCVSGVLSWLCALEGFSWYCVC